MDGEESELEAESEAQVAFWHHKGGGAGDREAKAGESGGGERRGGPM